MRVGRRPLLALVVVCAVDLLCVTPGLSATKPPAFHRDKTPLSAAVTKSDGSTPTSTVHDAGSAFGRMIIGLAIVIAVIYGVYWLLKKTARTRGKLSPGRDDVIQLMATTVLAPNRALHLVRIADEYLLIGSAEGTITRLRSYSAPPSPGLEPEQSLRSLAPAAKATGTKPIDRLRSWTVRT